MKEPKAEYKPSATPAQPSSSKTSAEKKKDKEIPSSSTEGAAAKPASQGGRLRRASRTGGIKGVLEGKKGEQEEEETEKDDTAINPDLPKEAFSEQELMNFWNEFLAERKKAKQKTTYSALKSCVLELQAEHVVLLKVESEAQVSHFEESKADLLRFLRQKLNNFSLSFELQKVESAAVLEPYSPQEKFEYMLQKNPHLLTLKQKLDLDLE